MKVITITENSAWLLTFRPETRGEFVKDIFSLAAEFGWEIRTDTVHKSRPKVGR